MSTLNKPGNTNSIDFLITLNTKFIENNNNDNHTKIAAKVKPNELLQVVVITACAVKYGVAI
jgi:hypothetical protein